MLSFKLLGRAVGLILLGLACVGVPMAIAKFGVLPALRMALATSAGQSPWTSALVMMIAMASGYWGFVHWIGGRRATELAPKPRLMLLGVVSAIALVGVPILAIYALGFYHVSAYPGFSSFGSVIPIILGAAVFEEIVFRGLIFANLERVIGSVGALIVGALVFAAPHMFNANWTGSIALVAGVLIGGMWTCLYMLWRNIWAVAFHHAAWNLTIVASGLPLSGLEEFRAAAPLRGTYAGPDLITGGAAGPEPSIVTLTVVGLAGVALFVIAQRTQKTRPILRG